MRNSWKLLGFLAVGLCPRLALAVSSAELYSGDAYGYGRVEARVRYAAGDGVVGSFFMWKDGSEQAGTFWNELDFEKLTAQCRLQTNPLYGKPAGDHHQLHTLDLDLCGAFHTYAFEWTPDAIAWSVDGMEIRRETGATAQAFADNASGGMQIHFNIWPGDASFGGNFDPAILPVHEYVDWVQFSKFDAGAFQLAWREDFNGSTVPAGWNFGNWSSPKNHSTHSPQNVNFINGFAVLSLTADNAQGPAGAMPGSDSSGSGAAAGTSAGGSATANVGGSPSTGAAPNAASGGSVSAAGTASAPATLNGGCSFQPASAPRGVPWSLAVASLAWLYRAARRRGAAARSRLSANSTP